MYTNIMYMILDNNTALKYIILSTSIHRVSRHGTVSRQTPVWQIPKVGAILIQCWPTIFDVGTPLIQHVLNVVHLSCLYHHRAHQALTRCWLNIGPASQTVGQHQNCIKSGSSVCWGLPPSQPTQDVDLMLA